MDIYLVRHGQTDGNVANRHQHPDTGLNELGRLQAQHIAKLLRRVKPTHLITSTNKRAMETAKYIGLVTDLIPETYPAFEELKRPVFLIGKRLYEGETLKYVWGWFFGLKTVTMHDGESYDSFRERIVQARTQLESLPAGSRVTIVSHAVFINFFLEHLDRDTRMGLRRAIRRLCLIFCLKNTSVTQVRYEAGQWRIIDRF